MSDQIKAVAIRICDLREISGMSQQEVAEKSGVPLEEYQAYEEGAKDFSFSHLFNIATTLGVDISDLLTGESPKLKGYILTRAGKGLAFERRKAYAPDETRVAHSHEGQEFDYVLDGHMKIVLDGNEVFLGPGDSLYYDSSIPHAMYALEKDAHFIAVVIK